MTDRPFNFYAGPEHEAFTFSGGDGAETGALLIHGFMGSPKELRPLGNALAAAEIDAHGILLPGFGAEIARLGAVRRGEWIEAASHAWDEIAGRYRRTILLGFSMGGAVALHLAVRRAPDRLILLAPFLRIADRRAVVLPLLQHVKKEFLPYENADFSRDQVRWDFQHIDPDLDLSEPAMQERIRREASIPTSSLVELRAMCLAAERLAAKSPSPALVMQGVNDVVTRPRDTRRLVQLLGGRLTFRELDADHMLPFDDRPWWPLVRDTVVGYAMEDRVGAVELADGVGKAPTAIAEGRVA